MTLGNFAATDKRSTARNTLTLSAMQSLGGTNPAIIVALGTIPAALLMRRMGRKGGYLLGAIMGVGAGLLAA